MIYFRRCAAKGDPVCVESLGILLLKTARTQADREEAYEHLAFSMDFGLPAGMRILADHFDNPATPDHDPARAELFDREAESREAEIGQSSPPSSPPRTGPTTFGNPNLPDPGGDADSGNDR